MISILRSNPDANSSFFTTGKMLCLYLHYLDVIDFFPLIFLMFFAMFFKLKSIQTVLGPPCRITGQKIKVKSYVITEVLDGLGNVQ